MRPVRLCAAAVLVVVTVAASAAQAPPYREQEVSFTSGEVKIAGTLSIPEGKGPFPAVVLLSGSGPQDRNSTLFGFQPFRVIADHLARVGIAVLRCDDRGVGGTTGAVPTSTTSDFADDALAAVRFLQGRSEIRGDRVGLLGHSEGALTASLAASRSPAVAFVVWMAGNAIPGAEILAVQSAALARASGASEEGIASIMTAHRHLTQVVRQGGTDDEVRAAMLQLAKLQVAALPEGQRKAMGDVDAMLTAAIEPQVKGIRTPWMRYFLEYDPATALSKVACPMLAIFGGRDLQVPADVNRAALEKAAAGGAAKLTVKVYPDANHLFQAAKTGSPAEYGALDKAFVPSLLDDIAAFITSHTR